MGTIAGCYVTQGKIQRNAEIRIVHNGIIVHEGIINSLKRDLKMTQKKLRKTLNVVSVLKTSTILKRAILSNVLLWKK